MDHQELSPGSSSSMEVGQVRMGSEAEGPSSQTPGENENPLPPMSLSGESSGESSEPERETDTVQSKRRGRGVDTEREYARERGRVGTERECVRGRGRGQVKRGRSGRRGRGCRDAQRGRHQVHSQTGKIGKQMHTTPPQAGHQCHQL